VGFTPETRLVTDELMKVFLVPFSVDAEAKPFQNYVMNLQQDFRGVAETFIDRLQATIQTTAIPFLLANQAAHDKHYQRFSMAERIRALKVGLEPDESEDEFKSLRNNEARQTANSKMEAFVKSEEGLDLLVAETARFLLHQHSSSEIQAVAREILLQGTVATWSALEMLVGDELILLLDKHPELVPKFLSGPDTKRKFELPKLNLEELSSRGFDLSNQMGHLLLGERDLSNFATLKSACEALIDSNSLREKLNDPTAWLLNQNRHLIVHRRGIVDEEYLCKTGAKLKVGDQLTISPKEFEVFLLYILSVGTEFLAGLASLAPQSSSLSNVGIK